MLFYKLKPECCGWFGRRTLYAGELETCPPTIYRLEYEFRTWPSDQLLEVNCQFIGSAELVAAVNALEPRATGVFIDAMSTTSTFEMRQLQPGRELPEYKWLKVSGTLGRDDFAIAPDYTLVVSDRILQAIKPLLPVCQISLYAADQAKAPS